MHLMQWEKGQTLAWKLSPAYRTTSPFILLKGDVVPYMYSIYVCIAPLRAKRRDSSAPPKLPRLNPQFSPPCSACPDVVVGSEKGNMGLFHSTYTHTHAGGRARAVAGGGGSGGAPKVHHKKTRAVKRKQRTKTLLLLSIVSLQPPPHL